MKLFRQIFALSIPAIVANLATPLMSMSDMAISGRMGGAGFIGAVALGGVIFNLLFWLLGFLRMGTSGLTAQASGAGLKAEVTLSLLRSLLVAVTIGVLIILLRKPLIETLLWFMEADGEVYQLTSTYCHICVWGAPAVLMTNSFVGWYVGLRNSRLPMWITLMQVVLNIVLSVVFVFGLGMNVDGLALGTMIAQWVAAIIFTLYAIRHIDSFHFETLFDFRLMLRFLGINVNIFLRTVCMVAVTFWFTRTGTSQGAVVLAANALIMQLFTLFSYFMDGFAYAAEGICGTLSGARDYTTLRRAMRYHYLIGGLLAVVTAVIYFTQGDMIIALISHDLHVNLYASSLMAWAAIIPLAGFAAFIGDGIAIGLIRTRLMLGSLVAATVVFFAVILLSYPSMGNQGLWLAFILYLATRSLIMLSVNSRR